jgi:hypothetical protein
MQSAKDIIELLSISKYRQGLHLLSNLFLPGYFFLYITENALVLNGAFVGNIPLIIGFSYLQYVSIRELILYRNLASYSNEEEDALVSAAKNYISRNKLITQFFELKYASKGQTSKVDLREFDEYFRIGDEQMEKARTNLQELITRGEVKAEFAISLLCMAIFFLWITMMESGIFHKISNGKYVAYVVSFLLIIGLLKLIDKCKSKKI